MEERLQQYFIISWSTDVLILMSEYNSFEQQLINFMTPGQRIQVQALYQTYLLNQLYKVKKNMQNQLLLEINKNLELQKLALNHTPPTTKKPPPPPPPKSQTEESEESQFSEYSESLSYPQKRKKCKKQRRRSKNDTKNIPKNFGKAIITFIEQHQDLTKKALGITGAPFQTFLDILKSKKRNLHSIAELRQLWTQSSFIYAREMRIISLYFLKKACLQYIFGSRISHYTGHIKYRNRFIQVLRCPKDFTCIKN